MRDPGCSSDEDLLRLLEGGAADGVAHHVEDCPTCRARLTRLSPRSERKTRDPGASAAGSRSPSDVYYDDLFTRLSAGKGEEEDGVALENTQHPEAIGRYRVVAYLGGGGQAAAYRAVHPEIGRDVVIKISHRPVSDSRVVRDRLRQEARILADLDHPGLARVYDLDVHEGRPFLVLEHIQGRTLGQLAADEPITARRAAALVMDLSRAIALAHSRGVVHRDIKPDNVIVESDTGRPRLIDFGIAQLRDAWGDAVDRPGSVSGTVAFMAPEQARGETDRTGPRTDVFALGALLYYLLTGRAPFEAPDLHEALRKAASCDFDRSALHRAPRRLQRICLEATAAEPGDRPAHATELAEKLESFLRRPRRVARAVSVAAAGIFVGLIVWAAVRPPDPRALPGRETAAPPGAVAADSDLAILVYREGRPLRLHEALPLRGGDAADALALAAVVPAAYEHVAAYWYDTKGKLYPLDVRLERTPSMSKVTYPDPDENDVVELGGPPGTELIFLCASASPLPGVEELEGFFDPGGPWPELQGSRALRLTEERVEPFGGDRGPGEGRRLPDSALHPAERLRRRLTERCEWLRGWAFPHVE